MPDGRITASQAGSDSSTIDVDDPEVPRIPVTLDDFAHHLRELRLLAGSPSYTEIARRVVRLRDESHASPWAQRPGRVTVYDVFRTGRRRLDIELVADILATLGRPELIPAWRDSYRRILRERPLGNARPRITHLLDDSGASLVGREEECWSLADSLASQSPGQTAIGLVSGLPGVGKTAVAREVALDVARRLPAAVTIEVALRTSQEGEDVAVVPAKTLASEVFTELRRGPAESAQATPVIVIDDVRDEAYLQAVADFLNEGCIISPHLEGGSGFRTQ